MEYRVEELASLVGVGVDTVRFYQSRGLLPAPQRRGRVALYGEQHLARLRQIRSGLENGLPLGLIKRLLDRSACSEDPDASLLEAVAEERIGRRTLSRAELAAESGVPEPLLRAAESAGLIEPLRVAGEERFSESDLAMARAGLAILSAGFPIDELLELAVAHARNVQSVVERAVEMFDRYVRSPGSRAAGDSEAVRRTFQTLLPALTRLVALHFQRTVVARALARLERAEDSEALRAALAAVESARLEVGWR